MTSGSAGAVHVAVYPDEQAARSEWQRLGELAEQGTVAADGLALVRRDEDGTVHVESETHRTRKGTVLGTVSGVVVGAIFPPAVLAAGAVGAGLGAGIGGLVSHRKKQDVAEEVDQALPRGNWAVVALLREGDAETAAAFQTADLVVSHAVEGEQAARAKAVALRPQGAIAENRSPMIG